MITLEIRPWLGDRAAHSSQSGALLYCFRHDSLELVYEKATIKLENIALVDDEAVPWKQTEGWENELTPHEFMSVHFRGMPQELIDKISLDDRLREDPNSPWAPGELFCNVGRVSVFEGDLR